MAFGKKAEILSRNVHKGQKLAVEGKISTGSYFNNDGIKVYVNVYNLKKMNNYLEIYDAILKNNSPKNACLYLDSNSKNYIYGSCDKVTIESSETNE